MVCLSAPERFHERLSDCLNGIGFEFPAGVHFTDTVFVGLPDVGSLVAQRRVDLVLGVSLEGTYID